MMKGRLRKELESTVVIVRSMLDIPHATSTVKDSLILYPIRQWTVSCGASEVGVSSDSDTETSQNKIDSNEVQFNFQGFNGRNEGTGRCILLYQGARRPL